MAIMIIINHVERVTERFGWRHTKTCITMIRKYNWLHRHGHFFLRLSFFYVLCSSRRHGRRGVGMKRAKRCRQLKSFNSQRDIFRSEKKNNNCNSRVEKSLLRVLAAFPHRETNKVKIIVYLSKRIVLLAFFFLCWLTCFLLRYWRA